MQVYEQEAETGGGEIRAERDGGDTGERGGDVERNGLAKEVGEEESIFCC